MKIQLSERTVNFEIVVIGLILILSGLILIYLSANGPFYLNTIKYKTSFSAISQIKGQDIINLYLIAPLLITGGLSHILNKKISRYIIILTPVYLMYYGLSMGIGMEWGSTSYSGDSEKLTFHFLFLIISGLVTMMYSYSLFKPAKNINFNKKNLTIYSVIFVIFILLFSSMWLKEVILVMDGNCPVSYDLNPVLFWVIRYLDLGFTIPLGFLSVYLLWTRPGSAFPVQLLFYGFFMTTVTAVCSMGFLMYIDNAPDFSFDGLLVFLALAVIVFTGFVYILKTYKIRG